LFKKEQQQHQRKTKRNKKKTTNKEKKTCLCRKRQSRSRTFGSKASIPERKASCAAAKATTRLRRICTCSCLKSLDMKAKRKLGWVNHDALFTKWAKNVEYADHICLGFMAFKQF